MDILDGLQDWYLSMCNGDWEHTYGIKIENIDNPGWAVTVELMDTPLYQVKFDAIEIQRAEENDWTLCRVEDGIFKGDCGPRNLKEVLRIFLEFASQVAK